MNLWRLSNSTTNAKANSLIFSDKCPTCQDELEFRYKSKKYDCDCSLQKLLQRAYLLENIGKKYHTLYLDDFVGKDADHLIKTIEEYIEDFEYNFNQGVGLTFAGDKGTGKTLSLCVLGKHFVRNGISFYFTTFDDLIKITGSSYKDEESQQLENKLKTIKVLGLDEFKTDPRNVNGFLAQMAENVIRFRTDNNLPTIITTNLDTEKEKNEFEKTHSLLSEKNIRITTIGEDIRGSLIRERNMKKDNKERKPIW